MTGSIHLSPAQITALARIEAPDGVALHQLSDGTSHAAVGDVYVTAVGSRSGMRIKPDGTISEMGETLPAS